MSLTWSHAVMYVRDLDNMLGFYTDVLGFEVTDRGPIGPDAPEIIFLSQDTDEHHQLAMLPIREDEQPSNSVNHFAFRVGRFDDVKRLNDELESSESIVVSMVEMLESKLPVLAGHSDRVSAGYSATVHI